MKRFKHLSTDLETPVIDRCPGDIKTISTQRFTKLVLPGVKVTDNVGVHSFLTNIQNGSEVTFGQLNITYTASDKAGNKAYCRFRITIAGTNNFRASSGANNLKHLQLPHICSETKYIKKMFLQLLLFLWIGVISFFISAMDSFALDHIIIFHYIIELFLNENSFLQTCLKQYPSIKTLGMGVELFT